MKKTIKEKLIWTDSRYRLGKIGQHTRLSIHSANLWIGYNITSVKITLTNPREREAMEEAIDKKLVEKYNILYEAVKYLN